MSFVPEPCPLPDECCPEYMTGFCLSDGTPIFVILQNGEIIGWIDLSTGVETLGPPPFGTGPCDPVPSCCPTYMTGFCLSGGTPITILLQDNVLSGWVNLETGVFTAGPPPAGFAQCPNDFPALVEDSPSTTGDLGFMTLAVRNDVAGSLVDTNGDYAPLQVDANGALRVTSTGGGGGGGTEFAEDSPHTTGDFGTEILGVRNDTGAALTTANGDYSAIATDAAGRVGITDLGGSITIDGTVSVSQPVAVTDNGGSLTVDAVDLDTRDLVFATDKVDVSGSTVSVVEPVSIDDNGGSLTVDAVDFDTRDLVFATDKVDVSGSMVSVTEPVSIDDNGSSITVDAVNFDIRDLAFLTDKVDVSGSTVTVNEPVSIDDNGGSITVDATNFDIRDLTFATDKVDVSGSTVSVTEPVSIDDNGGSITIDGTVTADTNFDYAEDTAHVSGDIGAFILAVRNDIPGSLVNLDGDYAPLQVDATGALRVTSTGGSTVAQFGEDDPAASGALGIQFLAVRNDAAATRTSADGDYSAIAVDAAGRVGITDLGGSITVDATNFDIRDLAFATDKVDVSGSTVSVTEPVSIDDNGGSITVDGTVTAEVSFDYAEDSAHVSGNTGAFILAVRNDVIGSLVDLNGDYAPLQVDATGALRVTGTTTIGGTVSVASDHPEDFIHLTGDIGSFILGVRNDTGAVLTSADGDYSPIATDSVGKVGITDLGGSISIDDAGGSITVDGTVALDAGTLAALESITVQNGAGAAAVNIQDGGNSITVDGTITADTNYDFAEDTPHTTGDQGAFILGVRNDAGAVRTSTDGDYSPISTDSAGRVGISDLGGSITVDGTVALDAGTLAALESITVQNGAGAAAVNIQDGGNSITVDGTVATNSERAEDSAHTTGQVGNFILAVRQDAQGSMVDTNGDYAPLQVDANGFLRVDVPNSSTNAGTSRVTVGAAAVSLLAAASRRRLFVQNVGTTIIYLGLGGTAPTTSVYYVALAPGSVTDDGKGGTYIDELWVGQLQAISSAAGGAVVVTELT